MSPSFPRKALVVLAYAAVTAALSLVFSPARGPLTLWLSDPAGAIVQWDTGYGWNSDQSEGVTGHGDAHSEAGVTFRVVKTFSYLSKIAAIRVLSKDDRLQAGVTSGDLPFERLTLAVARDSSGGYVLTASELPRTEGRGKSLLRWLNFIAGCLLLGGVGATIFLFTARLWKERDLTWLAIAACALGTLAFLLWWLYPGFLNPFNPVETVEASEHYRFATRDSLVLQMIWAAVYEVIPRLYALNAFGEFAFAAAVLYLIRRMKSLGLRDSYAALLVAALLFTPLGVVYSVFLERSVANGLLACACMIYVFILAAEVPIPSPSQLARAGFLAGLMGSFRVDSILSAFVLVLVPSFRVRDRKRTRWITTIVFAVFMLFQLTLLERWIGWPSWHQYSVISTVQTFSDMARASPLTVEERATASPVVDLDLILRGAPFTPIEVHQPIRRDSSDDQMNAYFTLYRRLVVQRPGQFLRSRFELFGLMNSWKSWWDFTNHRPGAMMDLQLLPPAGSEQSGARGARTLQALAQWPWCSLYLHLLAILAALLCVRSAPISAALGFSLLIRLVAVILAAPVPSLFYLYDVYLSGIFLVFAIAIERRRPGLRLDPN